jgi:ABC-type transport system substrate-binding protein
MNFHGDLAESWSTPDALTYVFHQEQWGRVGVQLEVRPLELATLFSDVSKGNFQITYQRWVGANTDPDFFEYASRRSASRPTAPTVDTIATRASTRSRTRFAWR